jgi:outer membrane protein OmpA-like peptidoglycan-associated protein
MQRRYVQLSILCFILLAFCGCAKKTTVVLLSDPDGNIGHLTVANVGGTIDMNHHAEATVVTDRESRPSTPATMAVDQIAAQFSEVLAMVPPQPVHFLLYFQTGSTDLTPDSAAMLPQILQQIVSRKSQNISVIGHSDRAGNWDNNLRLSKERALAVSRLLMKEGVPEKQIAITSHGEENPVVKTADDVAEPRNRRVEVIVK